MDCAGHAGVVHLPVLDERARAAATGRTRPWRSATSGRTGYRPAVGLPTGSCRDRRDAGTGGRCSGRWLRDTAVRRRFQLIVTVFQQSAPQPVVPTAGMHSEECQVPVRLAGVMRFEQCVQCLEAVQVGGQIGRPGGSRSRPGPACRECDRSPLPMMSMRPWSKACRVHNVK